MLLGSSLVRPSLALLISVHWRGNFQRQGWAWEGGEGRSRLRAVPSFFFPPNNLKSWRWWLLVIVRSTTVVRMRNTHEIFLKAFLLWYSYLNFSVQRKDWADLSNSTLDRSHQVWGGEKNDVDLQICILFISDGFTTISYCVLDLKAFDEWCKLWPIIKCISILVNRNILNRFSDFNILW